MLYLGNASNSAPQEKEVYWEDQAFADPRPVIGGGAALYEPLDRLASLASELYEPLDAAKPASTGTTAFAPVIGGLESYYEPPSTKMMHLPASPSAAPCTYEHWEDLAFAAPRLVIGGGADLYEPLDEAPPSSQSETAAAGSGCSGVAMDPQRDSSSQDWETSALAAPRPAFGGGTAHCEPLERLASLATWTEHQEPLGEADEDFDVDDVDFDDDGVDWLGRPSDPMDWAPSVDDYYSHRFCCASASVQYDGPVDMDID